MNISRWQRPLGCLKTSLRQARHHRLQQRSMATLMDLRGEPPKVPEHSVHYVSKRNRSKGFAIYKGVPSIRRTFPDPRPAWEQKQLARLDPTGARTRLFAKNAPDCAKVGDVLMVTTKTGEPFAGVCISIRRRGIDSAILLRGQLTKVGVEMWYKIYSPFVVGIDIVWRRPKRARRARLTYMRKPKHDMGSVDNLVFAWKKERAKLRGKGRAQGHGLETRFEP